MAKDEEVKKNEEETVTLKRSEFDDVMARLKRVESATSKAGLAKFDNQNREGLKKIVNLRTVDGKVVVGWSDMNKDVVEKNPSGVWYEDQKTTIFFEDKTEVKMEYTTFSRHYKLLPSEVVSETKKGNEVFFEVITEDGRKFDINSKFIN
jgi:hypothetical protein